MAIRSTVRISKSTVDSLKPGKTLWDAEIKGFGVRCRRQSKTYVLKVGNTWHKLGKHGELTPDLARREAQALLGRLREGFIPKPVSVTMAELGQRYLAEWAKVHKKPRTVIMDEGLLRNHILPLLGKQLVDKLTKQDIAKFQRDVFEGKTTVKVAVRKRGGKLPQGGRGAANAAIRLLSKVFSLAVDWNLRTDNPCKGIKLFKGNAGERFLSHEEIARLLRTIGDMQKAGEITVYAAAACKLLLFTGARRGEILNMRWQDINMKLGHAILEDSKTGRDYLNLNDIALELLQELPRTAGNPYIICGGKDRTALVNLSKPWQRIRDRAGIGDVRIHDLRHSFASLCAHNNVSLQTIGKLLRHKSIETTKRYSHLSDAHVRVAAQQAADAFRSLAL